MLFEKRDPAGQRLKPVLSGIDPESQRLILRFQLDDPLACLGELGPGKHAAVGAGLLQLAFRLQCSPAPAGQLLGEVADHLFEVAQRALVGPFVIVRHAQSPLPAAPTSRRWMPSSPARPASIFFSTASTSASRRVLSGARKVNRNATLRVPAGSSGPR